MKSKEIPQGAVVGIVAVVALAIVVLAYMMFFKAPPQIDAAKTVSPTRLEDPDPRSGKKL